MSGTPLEGVRDLFGKSLSNVTPANNDVPIFSSAINAWIVGAGGGGGEVNTASNIGTGEGLAVAKVVFDLPFKSLLGTAGEIILVGGANEVTFSIDAALARLAVAQTWTAIQSFGKDGVVSFLRFVPSAGDPSTPTDGMVWYNLTTQKLRTRENGLNVDVVAAGAGEANTISSQGGGTFPLTATVPKMGIDLRVISVSNGSGMNASLAADILTLAVAATVVQTDQTNTYNAGLVQAFTHIAAGAAGIRIVEVSGTPTLTLNGELALDSIGFIFRHGGLNQRIASLGQTQTFQNKTLDSTNTIQAGAYDAGSIDNADINSSAAIALSKLQDIATDRLLGRETAASGAIEEISLDATLELVTALTLRRAAITGDITIAAGSNSAVYNPLSIVNADINGSAAIAQSKLAAIVLANLPIGTAFQRYRTNSGATAIENFTEEAAFEFVIGDNDVVITTGIKLHLRVPFDCEIVAATLLNMQSGSIVVDVNRFTSLTNFNSDTKASITSATPPTTSSARSSEDTTLTSWTVVLSQGDILEVEVDSVTTVERTTLVLRVEKRG